MPDTEKPNQINVVAIAPFFRYAVGPANGRNPAIPFYTLNGAKKCLFDIARMIPWESVVLYKRRWFRGLDVIAQTKECSLLGWVESERARIKTEAPHA